MWGFTLEGSSVSLNEFSEKVFLLTSKSNNLTSQIANYLKLCKNVYQSLFSFLRQDQVFSATIFGVINIWNYPIFEVGNEGHINGNERRAKTFKTQYLSN